MTTATVARGPPMDAVKDEPSDSDTSPRRSLRCASRKPSESTVPPAKPEPVDYSHPDPDSPVDFSQKAVSVDGDANGSMDGPGSGEGTEGGSKVGPRVFTCDLCLKNFSNAANMRRHRIRHSGVKPFECKFCQKKFFRKDHMREHMAHKHNSMQVSQLECYFCQESFDKEKDLIQHVIREHAVNSRELHCHLCSFSASTIGRYLWHLSTSHPKKPLTYHAYTAPDPHPTVSAAPKRCKIFSAKRKIEDAGSEGSGESEKMDEVLENNIPPALPEFGGGVKYVSLLNPRMLEEREGGAESGGGNVYLLVAGEGGQVPVESNGHANQKAGSNRRKTKAPVRLPPTPDAFPPPQGVKREHSDSDNDSDEPVYHPEQPPAGPSASGMEAGSLNGSGATEHKCPYCLIAYPDNVMYLLHKMLHSRHQPYKCAVCQHQYPNRYEFYAHIVNHRP